MPAAVSNPEPSQLTIQENDLLWMLTHRNRIRRAVPPGTPGAAYGADGGGCYGPVAWFLDTGDIVELLELGAQIAKDQETPEAWNRVLALLGWQPDPDFEG